MPIASPLIGFDRYTRGARIAPAAIVGLPVALAFTVWFSDKAITTGILGGVVALFALTALLAQLGRDEGKRKEPALIAAWGGMPTHRKLRHRDPGLNTDVRKRYHTKLQSLLPTVVIPSETTERLDPEAADRIYESCVVLLRESTRDRGQFALLHEENINYGFRRNLWALKRIGLLASLLGLAASMMHLALLLRSGHSVDGLTIASILLDAVLIGLWVAVITPQWVRVAGDAYADRLLAACEQL